MLENLDSRKAFDIVKKHLLTQRRRAHAKDSSCVYRQVLENGDIFKCSVGALIPDELYDESMEGSTVEGNLFIYYPKLVTHFKNVDKNLLIALQKIHDQMNVCYWERLLDNVETEYFNN